MVCAASGADDGRSERDLDPGAPQRPNGLRVVLDQEFPSDCDAAGDLTGINCEDLATLPLDEPPATILLQ